MVIILAGPTASGKSRLALSLARTLSAEILCADAITFYRGFDIGSAKPTKAERTAIPHHGLDVLNSHQRADVGWFSAYGRSIIERLQLSGKPIIVVGGSNLYLRGLMGDQFHQLPSDTTLRTRLCQRTPESLFVELQLKDPHRASQIHPNDHFRLARALEINLLTGQTLQELTCGSKDRKNKLWLRESLIYVGVTATLSELQVRIEARVEDMISRGLIGEVEDLLRQGVSASAPPLYSVGYKQVLEYVLGCLSNHHSLRRGGTHKDEHQGKGTVRSLSQLRELITTATRQLARKQIRWLNKQSFDVQIPLANIGQHDQILKRLSEAQKRL